MFSFDCNENRRKVGNEHSDGIPDRPYLRDFEVRQEREPSESVGILEKE
jgi:hypothetical protein